MARGRLERWGWRVWAGASAFLLVAAVVDGQWTSVAAAAVVLLALAASAYRERVLLPRRRASARVVAWTPERLAAVLVASGGDHVAAVKAVRRTDPTLSLVEADRLVRGITPG